MTFLDEFPRTADSNPWLPPRPMPTAGVAGLLGDALYFLEVDGWVQLQSCDTEGRRCLSTAILKAASIRKVGPNSQDEFNAAFNAVIEVIYGAAQRPFPTSIISFNDAVDTTWTDVKRVVEAAITGLER